MRSHYSSEINETIVGKVVEICGWVHRRRDHGGVIFFDIRDRTGLVQLVYEPEVSNVFQLADSVRHEYVIQAKGCVKLRPSGQENPDLISGKIEIIGQELTLLNHSKTIPFQLDEYQHVSEDVRLKYRYIDLRRSEMQNRLIQRSRILQFVRQYLNRKGFLDLETPYLTKATPEGARDYLVPSRNHHGRFYALPQSPQLFKQLFMISGFDRYYQIVKCFRDEDLRSDRQPEFTQIDIEASFVDENVIMNITESMIRELFKFTINIELPKKFPIISYSSAIEKYGSDKPDLRIPLHFIEISHIVQCEKFKIFSTPANSKNSRVVAMKLHNGSSLLSRKMLDDYAKFIEKYGAKGLAYIKVNDISQGKNGLQSPIVKNLSDTALSQILEETRAMNGDIIFFGAGKSDVVNRSMDALRNKIAKDLKLYITDWAPVWITNFPMFEKKNNKLHALHHPFTAPKINNLDELIYSPEKLSSRAYDMVINGYEVGGGSIRIHDQKTQKIILKILGINECDTQEDSFNFLLDSLQYGAPPHGGIAFGLDRLTMLITGTNNIRDVIAFPKTQTASCLMTNAPTKIRTEQLHELAIHPISEKK